MATLVAADSRPAACGKRPQGNRDSGKTDAPLEMSERRCAAAFAGDSQRAITWLERELDGATDGFHRSLIVTRRRAERVGVNRFDACNLFWSKCSELSLPRTLG